jgi:hypothetical protein
VRSTARKTYGKTASGERITDALIEELSRKAEVGYEIEEMTQSAERPSAAEVMDEAIDLAVEGRSPYPDRAAFIDAGTASAGNEIKRAADEGLPVVLVAADGSRCALIPPRLAVESQSERVGVEYARYPELVSNRLPSTTPTAEKPALSEAQRTERLRLLAKRLRRADGLDRDVLKRIEQLTGDEQ